MRGLQGLVVFLGLVIVAMMTALVVGLAHRLHAPASVAASVMLDEPAGTHMQSIAASGEYLAVLLQGGGADRIVFVDPAQGRVVGRVGLAK